MDRLGGRRGLIGVVKLDCYFFGEGVYLSGRLRRVGPGGDSVHDLKWQSGWLSLAMNYLLRFVRLRMRRLVKVFRGD